MRVLVFGASGMLGNAVLRLFDNSPGFQVFGTVRGGDSARLLPESIQNKLLVGIDVENPDVLLGAFKSVKPDLVINCIGLVKQLSSAEDPLKAIPINSLLPHRLACMSSLIGARFIHLSTDCVFSGEKGMYLESDNPDAYDLYGRSKFLGEVDYENAITLRTSIIGHELSGSRSLVDWFLNQKNEIRGFRRAVFSGLPTVEVARIIRDYVIPNEKIRGVYHLSADPINKFDLLKLVARTYGKKIQINPDDDFVIDRSLDSTRFRNATGFHPSSWSELINSMREFR